VRYTPPLTEDFAADIDSYLPAIRHAWIKATGHDLAEWQVDILRRVTEVFPEGHERACQIRFREAFVSLGRQNGKTELAAAFGLYALLRDMSNAYVIGVAKSREQADLIYNRTMKVIRGNPALSKRFPRLTETRGIKAKAGAKYEIKASASASLQGIPVSAGLCDEVHLLKTEVWDALLAGTGGRPNTLIFGITTAGSDESVLLKRLYANAEASIDGDLERFGGFIFEAPESEIPESDELLGEYITAANPAVAAGYKDLETVISDVRSMPESEATRYILNRFVKSSSTYLPPAPWNRSAHPSTFPMGPGSVIAIDRTPDWRYASIAAARKVGETTHTELVAWPLNPSVDQLVNICADLYRAHRPSTFVVDSWGGKDLAIALKRRGFNVQMLNRGDNLTATSLFYAKTVRGQISHGGEPLMSVQLQHAAKKSEGVNYRLIPGDKASQIDAIQATLSAVYVAENQQDTRQLVF
jgi:phage terminase large subunit-like protein